MKLYSRGPYGFWEVHTALDGPRLNQSNCEFHSCYTINTRITLDNSNRFSSPIGVRNVDVQLYNVAHILHIEEKTIILSISGALGKEEVPSNHAMPINL